MSLSAEGIVTSSGRRRVAALLVIALGLAVVASALALAAGRAIHNVAVTPNDPKSYQAPWLAADPKHAGRVAIGYAEGRLGATSYLAQSSNSGRTWRSLALAGLGAKFALGKTFTMYRRPAIAYDGSGTLYAVFDVCQCENFATRHSTLFITKSADGIHFSLPRIVDRYEPPASDPIGGQGDTQPRIAIDQGTGRIYVTWTRYAPNFAHPTSAFIASSSNGGRSFSRPQQLNSGADAHPAELPVPAVGPDGTVYVAFNDLTEFDHLTGAGAWNVLLRSSRDHGRTFSRAVRVAHITALGCEGNVCLMGDYSFTPGPFVPAAGIQPGEVFVTYSARARVNGTPRIFVVSSRDAGRRWSRPRIIGIPLGGLSDRQIRPWVSVARDGRVDVVYYDLTPTDTYENTYYISSANGGRTFSRPILLSSRPSDVKTAPFGGKRSDFGNAYLQVGAQVASVAGRMFAAWTDSRRGTESNGKQDIYSASMRISSR